MMIDKRKRLADVTRRLTDRSQRSRQSYLDDSKRARDAGPNRVDLPCANFAHAFAACAEHEKQLVRSADGKVVPNVAIINAYNDVLSAHQPLEDYPKKLKKSLAQLGAIGQVASGVPAMCDGVTQGQAGMELSLFSRDVIAMSTAVALSHGIFDAGICLGVCDKIVPGLLIGALRFGHLPFAFVPAGPMPSGLNNEQKGKLRVLYAEGKIDRQEMLAGEMQAYHSPGTCTFYGTANSNQMLMEIMGLHLPGGSFENPVTPMREALTAEAARRVVALCKSEDDFSISAVVNEKSIINAVVGLLATGGSTNHTIHLLAIARAAGILLQWEDFDELSEVVPLLARVYPNGSADVNHFHAAGGMAFVISELLDASLLHADVQTLMGDAEGLVSYTRRPRLNDEGRVEYGSDGEKPESRDQSILRPVDEAFEKTGGLRLLQGNLGRGVIKVSAVPVDRRTIEAPAKIFQNQQALIQAFEAGQLERDFIAVVIGQGPQSNGMPELHKMTPPLTALQNRGFKVALVTDGRMSGASGKVPAAIHVTPEVAEGGPLAKLRDGDVVRLDCESGVLEALVPEDEWNQRELVAKTDLSVTGMGRELFGVFRRSVAPADQGASVFFADP